MKQPLDSAKEVAQATSGAIFKTAGFLTSTIKGIGKGVFQPIASSLTPTKTPEPGTAPGIEHYLKHEADHEVPVRITILDYGPEKLESREFDSVEEALACPRHEPHHVRWINVDGLKPSVVDKLCKHYGIHTLSAEDVLNTYQRPKFEAFEDHLLVVARQIQLVGDQLKNEQISFFLFEDVLISFQEEVGDVFGPVRKRLENPAGRFRTYKADYLFYALLDSIVDHLFPLLEGYGIAMEDLEMEILKEPSTKSQQRLFAMKRDLSLQRRALWPIREVVDQLYRDESGLIHPDLRTFYRDVQDHTMQVIDLLETYRDTASGLSDLYQSSVGNKMNEIMKVLTIMASFFIPITFVAGVYGMNFEYIPELAWHYSYFVFWGICLSMTGGLAFYFWRKGWIGKDK
ncbi:magnesium/cobalt transporter CorA [Coraliomargarita parva]|uniref:magnesium/cobalt transporter CorA n=1 Tax=Coraliomargarita parva TaxID=3014050 RepID=UPI0022B5BF8B|nr:magnesium/cobalt transporter CorA [Coraliomargarita parva]